MSSITNANDDAEIILAENMDEKKTEIIEETTVLKNSSHVKNMEESISKIIQGDAMQFIPFASTLFEFLTEDMPDSSSDKMKVANHIGTKAAFVMSLACKQNEQHKKEIEGNASNYNKYFQMKDIIGCTLAGHVLNSSTDTLQVIGFVYLLYKLLSTKELQNNKYLIEKNKNMIAFACAWIQTESVVGTWNKFKYGVYIISLWNIVWNLCRIYA